MGARSDEQEEKGRGREREKGAVSDLDADVTTVLCFCGRHTDCAANTRQNRSGEFASRATYLQGCPTSRPCFSSPAVQSRVRLKQFPVSPRFTGALNAFLSPSDPPDSALFAVPSHGCMPAPLSRDRRLVSLCQPVVVRDRSGKSVV